ncbi:isoprenyl transferase [Clostridium estertheticum]|uniref:Isoprenyl transferase n=2 Tax=Clostridium estertheticum TaxID=238834 RepID=A0A7Y3WSR9_9CLOT|nr:isoprenyl transferase [Clostridium estertheticum]MBW9170874.1 isoprenyl transferase [Clostridium estertheticum]NNU76229.1 isoprenyl transferase [Clostridium estertheticum]WLC74289.1 isoprenyl transferase [Clostridium estertheticum]
MKKLFAFLKKNKVMSNEPNLDMSKIPKHIAIIMDGNGRWAKERNLPRALGHKAGVEAIRRIVKECDRLGVKYLTLYAFSTENWNRPIKEVDSLMKLLVEYLKKEVEELNVNDVVVNSIGNISKLPLICREELKNAYKKTRNNKGLILNLALNYGGRSEIVDAVKEISSDLINKKISKDQINEELFSKYMYTSKMPDPDLIIRPSGELRLSNFLLWQGAYSELWFSDINWPDFHEKQLQSAIMDYQKRDRRFGKVK